jgi:type III secretion system FlhB-like substrate exporter
VTDIRRRVVAVGEVRTDAPVVVAKASGETAETVLEQARLRQGLPVVRDAALVDQLYRVPVSTAIAKDLFPVMASLLVHVLTLDKKLGGKR